MNTIQTKQNETVLEGFYPKQFDESSSSEIYKIFLGLQLPDKKLFVVIGTDSGLMVDYLLSIATTQQRFIFIDHAEVIDFLKQKKSGLLEGQSNFKAEFYTFEAFDFEILYDAYQDYVIRNAVIILSSILSVNDDVRYQGMLDKYKELFFKFRVDRIDNYDFKKVFDQQIESACDLRYPLPTIKGALKGEVPGVILGGGPSLDAVIPWLKKNQNNIWIFAASRICKRLLKEGITPDFIGTFDGQPLIFDYSKEMYAFEEKSILITGEHPYAPLIRQWSGLKTYSRRRFPWAKGAEEHFISDGPTVTNALFGIGSYLGVSQLYLAGVDFCFTPEGVCHESGSIEAKNKQRDSSDTTVLNYRGERVATNIQLYDARNSLEERVVQLKASLPELSVYNLNNGAAVINGVECCSIEDIELNVQKFNVVDTLSDLLYFDAKTEKNFQRNLSQEVSAHSKWLFSIVKEAKKGLQLTEILFSEPSKQSKRIKQVLKLKKKLEKLIGVDYQTFVNYGYQAFMETLQPVESEEEMSQQEMKNSLRGFFGGLQFAAEGFLVKLEELKSEIKFRLLELNPETDFLVLVEGWLHRGIPGRFHVWLAHFSVNPYEYYQKEYSETVIELEEAFQEMKTDETALENAFKQRLSSPEAFIFRLNKAFEAQNLEEVLSILRQLSLITSAEYYIARALAAGMKSELAGSPEDALIFYQSVDPYQKQFWIQQQVFSLAFRLEQPEKGLQALHALSLMNIKYLPKYAEALALLGDPDSAISAYQAYPLLYEDTEAMIFLIRLLVQQQQVESANILLKKAETSEFIDQIELQTLVDSFNNVSQSK
ncbi:MAG: DUF115 domain-containing protein [Thiomicrorhabdus sp.]|nr:DUF115 domain-containing protein [Thiomicrorhabdus sp.]